MSFDTYTVTSDLDSGSTESFWSSSAAHEYLKAGGAGRLTKLKFPFKVLVAGTAAHYCTTAIILPVRIPTVGGEVLVHDVFVYLVDGTWTDVFLLGWPVLQFLGVTPEQGIQHLAGREYKMELPVAPELITVTLDSKAKSLLQHCSHIYCRCCIQILSCDTRIVLRKLAKRRPSRFSLFKSPPLSIHIQPCVDSIGSLTPFSASHSLVDCR